MASNINLTETPKVLFASQLHAAEPMGSAQRQIEYRMEAKVPAVTRDESSWSLAPDP